MKKSRYLGIRVDKWVFMIAAIVTFAICGIWHGESLNYLIWGLLFGVYLTVAAWKLDMSKYLRKALHISRKSLYYRFYGVVVTFILVSFAWIFFRADSFTVGIHIIRKILTSPGHIFSTNPSDMVFSLMGIILLILVDLKREYSTSGWSILYSGNQYVRIAGIVFIIMTILLAGVFDGGQFIYFQF